MNKNVRNGLFRLKNGFCLPPPPFLIHLWSIYRNSPIFINNMTWKIRLEEKRKNKGEKRNTVRPWFYTSICIGMHPSRITQSFGYIRLLCVSVRVWHIRLKSDFFLIETNKNTYLSRYVRVFPVQRYIKVELTSDEMIKEYRNRFLFNY